MLVLRETKNMGRGVFAVKALKPDTYPTKYPSSKEPIHLRSTGLIFDSYASPDDNFDSGVEVKGGEMGHYLNDGSVPADEYRELDEFLQTLGVESVPKEKVQWIVDWFERNVFMPKETLVSRINCTLTEKGIRVIKPIAAGEELLVAYGFYYWWAKVKAVIMYHGKITFIRELGKEMNRQWLAAIDTDSEFVAKMRIEVGNTVVSRYPEMVDGKASPYLYYLMMLSEMVFARHHVKGLFLTVCPSGANPREYGLRTHSFQDDDPWVKAFTKRVSVWLSETRPFPAPETTPNGFKRNQAAVAFIESIDGDVWVECAEDPDALHRWEDHSLTKVFAF